jgi:hypothetical protein
MIGYKAFNKDLTCRDFQYEIGQTYSMDEKPIPCGRGFHFCKSIAETYNFYPTADTTRICKVEALGEVATDDEIKYCTNKIKILEEITEDWERKGNSNSSNSGYRNSGDWNSGDSNSGYRNSGDWNSGDRNSGDWNSGDSNSGYRNSGEWNSGDSNSGYRNSGDWNSGYSNSGYRNSGDWNSGNWNSGYRNSGDWNSGDWNSGYSNSGYRNSGDRNSGDWNSGDSNSGNRNSGNRNSGKWNSGDWNSGNRNSGLFNTEKNPKLKMFDKESDWTIEDWYSSDARNIMDTCPCTYSGFISESDMTDGEKENHPEFETIGGYVKTFIVTKEDKEKWWNELDEDKKDVIKALPNFDFDKFRQCVGF